MPSTSDLRDSVISIGKTRIAGTARLWHSSPLSISTFFVVSDGISSKNAFLVSSPFRASGWDLSASFSETPLVPGSPQPTDAGNAQVAGSGSLAIGLSIAAFILLAVAGFILFVFLRRHRDSEFPVAEDSPSGVDATGDWTMEEIATVSNENMLSDEHSSSLSGSDYLDEAIT
jgi:hypothetical protein